MNTQNKILRIKEVQEMVGGYSRTSIWRLEKLGQFPKRRQLGPRAVGWLQSEIEEWINSRLEVEPKQAVS